MTTKPDRLGVTFGQKVALRVTHDWEILLNEKLTKTELRDVVHALAQGMSTVHATVLEALTAATGNAEPNGACPCPRCNLIRLRKLMDTPVLH